MTMRISKKLRDIFTDTVWSVAGLVLMNVIAQFAVYPFWNRALGSEAYGEIVYSLAIMNVMAISIGIGVNYTRMRKSAEGATGNRPYLLLMSAGTFFSILVLAVLQFLGLLHLDAIGFLMYCLLTAATLWRYYADVEYRLHIDYRGYFFYYLSIGIGYLVGIGLFKLTGLWPLALLPGELAGLTLVLWRGSVFRNDGRDDAFAPILKLSLLLIGSNLLSHLIFNGDRIILRLFAGRTAVSVYYIASLFGKTMTLVTTPLNGVLVGHLAKYRGKLTVRMMNHVAVLATVTVLLATVVCIAASELILPLLYPADYPAVKQFLILANAAQVVYFIGNVLTASVLLRFTVSRNQLMINAVHGILFLVVCVPSACKLGVNGFCWGLLIINLMRFMMCVLLCYCGVNDR